MPAIPGSQVQGQPQNRNYEVTKTFLSQENQSKRGGGGNKDRETWILFWNCQLGEKQDPFVAFCVLKGKKKRVRSRISSWVNFLNLAGSCGESGAALESLIMNITNSTLWLEMGVDLVSTPRAKTKHHRPTLFLPATPPACCRLSPCPGNRVVSVVQDLEELYIRIENPQFVCWVIILNNEVRWHFGAKWTHWITP